MIGASLSEFVIVATFGLVALPLLARILWRGLRPVEHTRFNLATLAGGTALLVTALVVCAIALMRVIDGGLLTTHHLLPWDAAISAVSALLLVGVLAVLAAGWLSVRHTEQLMRIEPSIAEHRDVDGVDLVLVDTNEPLAYALGGRYRQVVVSRALVEMLPEDELRSVIEHEMAHLRLGHHRHLRVVGLLTPLARRVRVLASIVDSARVAIEQAADADTTDPRATRRALLHLSGVPTPVGANGFAGTAVVERLRALDDRPGGAAGHRVLLYATALLLTLVAASGLVELLP